MAHEVTRLIGSAEAARRLGVDRSHLNRLVRMGAIRAVTQLDGRTGARLFDPEVIDQAAVRRHHSEKAS